MSCYRCLAHRQQHNQEGTKMGLFRESLPGHEGYPVAYVEMDDERARSAGHLREVHYPEEHAECIVAVAAGCDCGWRSPRINTREATWFPFVVQLPKHLQDRVDDLVIEHFDHMQTGARS
jgi:hypothetical protein